MNNLPMVTIVGWSTRNWRHRRRAIDWCRDYGLQPILRDVFAGELYPKERAEFEAKIRLLFRGKTERTVFVSLCKSCFNASVAGMNANVGNMKKPDFEIIQLSSVLPEKARKR